MTDGAKLRRLFAILVHDGGLKLLSLAAAIIFFSVVHGAEDAQKTIYVDVISLLPEPTSGRMLITEIPARVRLTLTGGRSRLAAIRQEQMPAIQVDLRDTSLREYEFSSDDFDLPLGVAVTEMEPAELVLEWARRRERRVRIKPTLAGQLPDGFRVRADPVVEPGNVVVVGPADEVSDFDFAQTAEIDLSSLHEGDNERRVRLLRPPAHAYFVDDPTVTVNVHVEAIQAERTITRLDVGVVGALARSVRPTRVSVTIFGQPSVVQAIDPDGLFATVELGADAGGRGGRLLPVQIRGLPADVRVRAISPAEVLVTPGP